MSNILYNFPTIFLWMLLCLSARTTLVLCDEQPIELSPESDIKKISATTATTEYKVEESTQELKSKDGDTLDASPSQHSQQTDYNYVVSKSVSPLSIDLGPQSGSVQTSAQDQQISTQYESGSQGAQQPPSSVIYRYTTGADGVSTMEQPTQQQTYIRQEPQHQIQSLYEPKSYVRQALLGSNIPDSVSGQSSSAGYRVPDLPMKPGVSTTYYSPNVKIVSHTRSFLPVVYNKPTDESSEGSGQSSGEEQEYDKAVQDRPGGSYSQQQADSYESNSQSDDQEEQSGPAQPPYEKSSNGYRNEEQDRNPEVLSRGPYYNIHKPHVAHIQVIEDKDEYNSAKNKEHRGQSYGYRTQPRPQYKNYKPSGYQPGMLDQYDPPSPPLSALLQTLPKQSSDSDDDSYDNREQSGRPHHLPEPQPLQQLSQSPQEYKQRPGVEIEFDQSQKNEPNVVRGPGVPYRRPNNYNEGESEEQNGNDGQDYNQEQERPNEYESGNRGQEFINNNQLGPKYNVGGDEPEQDSYKRGRPQQQHQQQQQEQQQQLKPQEVEYGFIPLTEGISESYRGGPEAYRGRPMRPNRPNEGGYGPEGYRNQRGYGGNGGELRRPQYNGPQEGLGIMYGRGQAESNRVGGYNGNDIYRDTPIGQAPPSLGTYRKPAFERPHFVKNGGEDNSGFSQMTPYGNGLKVDEGEEMDSEEGDYGKKKDIKSSADNNEDDMGPSDPNKLPHICYPWNCNPWHAIHPDSPYNSGLPLKGRGPHSGSGLPPGASYNPRDVGLDEAVVAQLNLAASSPTGIAPGIVPHGIRGGMRAPAMEMSYSANRPFPNYNAPGIPAQRPKPLPFSASGQGYRSQYGYRAAASELSPVSAAQSSPTSANSPVLSNLLNLNPVKSFRSLMSYLTGGLNE